MYIFIKFRAKINYKLKFKIMSLIDLSITRIRFAIFFSSALNIKKKSRFSTSTPLQNYELFQISSLSFCKINTQTFIFYVTGFYQLKNATTG